jgi:UDP-N-acetylmuramate dehydrogenase
MEKVMITPLAHALGVQLLRDEPLAKYTAARIGGPADWLYVARGSVEELSTVVQAAWAQGMPVRVIGGGANVLVADKGVRGLVVVNRVAQVVFGEWHEGRTASATAGVNLTTFANKCQKHGLAGMGWAVSVPGTVGGAIVNNAGAHGDDMAASVADVVVLEPDGPKLYTVDDLAYGYRCSTLKARDDRRFLVLLATFKLPPDDPAAIKARMVKFKDHRKRTQPPGASLGSIFKNPPGDYAGRLIEAAGLKGYRIGTALVSPVHANFFLNDGAANATDYRALIDHAQRTVYAQTGIWLETEIELIGEWS